MDDLLFGRKWNVKIMDKIKVTGKDVVVFEAGSESFDDPESIQVSFDIVQTGYKNWWYADITLFNLNETTNSTLMKYGLTVVMSAGYQGNAPYGEIFRGRLFQPMWERHNVTDYATTLRCAVGKIEDLENFVEMSIVPQMTEQNNIIRAMAKNCYHPLNIEKIPDPGSKKMDRTVVLFDTVGEYLKILSQDNNYQYWISPKGINMTDIMQKIPADKALVISSKTGIVGTPQQVQDGITFKTLLDNRLKVMLDPAPMQVKIDNTWIRQEKRTRGISPSMFDKDGYYNIAYVHHYGDTRGPDWYTECVGVTNAAGKAGLLIDLYAQSDKKVDNSG